MIVLRQGSSTSSAINSPATSGTNTLLDKTFYCVWMCLIRTSKSARNTLVVLSDVRSRGLDRACSRAPAMAQTIMAEAFFVCNQNQSVSKRITSRMNTRRRKISSNFISGLAMTFRSGSLVGSASARGRHL